MAQMHKPAILHVDMDAFFASVEQRDNPLYRGKPLIVGGSVESRGVVSTASYEARKFGVHSAMPMAEAVRLCPQGIVVPGNYGKYRAVSGQIMEIFHRYTPEVEALSLDEAFLDLTGSQSLFGPAEDIGREIKAAIQKELELTASVGLSYNKFLAKIASDLEKPDGFCTVWEEDVPEKIWPLSIGRMMGVGQKTKARLEQLGIQTIGQLARVDVGLLQQLFGGNGLQMHQMANGIDHRRVEAVREVKSMGRETTFPKDIAEREALETVLFTLTDEVAHSLRKNALRGKTISIKLKNARFETKSRGVTKDAYLDDFESIYAAALGLLRANYTEGTPIRLIGVTVSNLKPLEQIVEQQDLFASDNRKEKLRSLNQTLDAINDKYGSDMIYRARKIKDTYGKE